MDLHEVLGSPQPIDIEVADRVDTGSGFTSPIAPPGAPSDAGSLFSRVRSPKPAPAMARFTAAPRLSTIRSETPGSTRTKNPPVTPPKASHVTPSRASHITPPKTTQPTRGFDNTPKSQRSARPGSSAIPVRPESPPDDVIEGRTQGRGPGSVFSRGPESSYSPQERPNLEWKLDLPQSSDPLTFQSLLVSL
ncbi:hypothetical protein BN14_07914 [Rhizoctonia solani AG-1 IB]|uniref:Uncharacterized protein n=1 Tax=Thanatephorus cucumeris (strain AG1-IB / isolate 7/3/14) TaxID=1108050 RepID=M5C1F5_THACB|nr:hypothetical protein BN14_07914 [Rhizoctonia solani AG-1 IB]